MSSYILVSRLSFWRPMTLKCYGYQLCIRDLFSNTCRYIDDLLTLHDPDFQAHICQIYLSELEFYKKTQRVMMAAR